MSTTDEVEPGQRIDLSREVIGLYGSDRRARLVEQERGRPPKRIDGFTVGAPMLTEDPPHKGEMHPDGDELVYVVSGVMSVLLELPDGDRTITVTAGEAVVVPQGIWHRIHVEEPGRIIHITPGPNGEHRSRRDPSDQ